MTMVLCDAVVCDPSVGSIMPGVARPPAVACEGQRAAGGSNEGEIIRLAQEGDAAAFEHLYRTHCRRIHALCYRMTGNFTLAEDLTQDVFLQVFRKIQTFRAESAFSTWLYRLAVNIVLMRRRIKTLNEMPLEWRSESESDVLPRREFGRPDQRVAGVVDRLNLKRALRQLPRGYRQIFLLHDVMGYQHHEIAEALGCSIGNSKSQLHKARMRLRTILRNGNSAKLASEGTLPAHDFSSRRGRPAQLSQFCQSSVISLH